MTSNHVPFVPLISARKMTFRMTFRMSFRTSGLQRGLQTGLRRGLAVKLRSGKVQVRSGQVWFSLQLKFNSLKLDSEVGRFVLLGVTVGHILGTPRLMISSERVYPDLVRGLPLVKCLGQLRSVHGLNKKIYNRFFLLSHQFYTYDMIILSVVVI